MADVRPFQGLRFPSAVAPDIGLVLCPPYDVIDAADDLRLRERHPYNLVRLELTTASVAGGPEGRYEEAARTLRAWREQGVLVQEQSPAYYLHEARFPLGSGQATRRELIAAVGVVPWEERVVLPHERTYPRAKADRLKLLHATGTNLSPILVFFRRDRAADVNPVDAAWDWALSREPDAAGTDSEAVAHRLWVLTEPGLTGSLQEYFAERPLFIADGHHRYETALNYLEDCRREAGTELPPDHPARFVMMHLIAEDDPGLVILPLHRLLTGITAADVRALVERLKRDFEVEVRPDPADADMLTKELRERGARGQALALVPAGDERVVMLTRRADAPIPAAVFADRDPAWQTLDVVLLDATIAQPLLNARHLSAEDAIAYTRDAQDAIRRVKAGEAGLAILVNPTRVEQVANVALAAERMPEKSTYFFPKAPTGLVLRPLE